MTNGARIRAPSTLETHSPVPSGHPGDPLARATEQASTSGPVIPTAHGPARPLCQEAPGRHEKMNIIQELESELGKPEDSLPHLNVGDDVEVDYLIREGEKERIQTFKGLILSIQGRGLRRTIVVRRIVQGEGVERTFPLHNPRVHDITVTKRGRVRRSKLFYMRDRVGKSTRTKERLGEKVRLEREAEKSRRAARKKAAEAPAPSEEGAE